MLRQACKLLNFHAGAGQADNLLLDGIIGGGKNPKSIQAYLKVLVCELDQMWQGVQMYDASKKETFTMRAMLACNMHDYPEMRAVALEPDSGDSHTSECASR